MVSTGVHMTKQQGVQRTPCSTYALCCGAATYHGTQTHAVGRFQLRLLLAAPLLPWYLLALNSRSSAAAATCRASFSWHSS
jgi:hypothetical protein